MSTIEEKQSQPIARYLSTLVYVDGSQVVLLEMLENIKIIAVAIPEEEGFSYSFFWSRNF